MLYGACQGVDTIVVVVWSKLELPKEKNTKISSRKTQPKDANTVRSLDNSQRTKTQKLSDIKVRIRRFSPQASNIYINTCIGILHTCTHVDMRTYVYE